MKSCFIFMEAQFWDMVKNFKNYETFAKLSTKDLETFFSMISC